MILAERVLCGQMAQEPVGQDRLPSGYENHYFYKPNFASERINSSNDGQLTSQLNLAIRQSVVGGQQWKIVVDLSEIKYIGSAGFRTLLSAQREVKRGERGGEVVLADCQSRVKEALALSGFDELFPQIELLPVGKSTLEC